MELTTRVEIVETTDELRLKIADEKPLVLIKTQGRSAKPCLFVNKKFLMGTPEALETFRSMTHLSQASNVEKKSMLGLLCNQVHAYETDPDFVGILTSKGFEATVKEAQAGKLESDLPVHPLP